MSTTTARFLRAASEHDVTTAQRLLEEHPEFLRESIHAAAAAGNADAVSTLLAGDAGRATAAVEPGGITPIILAVHAALPTALGVSEAEQLRTVQLLLDAGASANSYVTLSHDPNARIPALYFACVSNNVPVVRLLLQHGATPNDGESVYHAAELNHRECLGVLLEYGAQLGHTDQQHGNTPLYFLAGSNPRSPGTPRSELGMHWLLEHGADPSVPSYVNEASKGKPWYGETPLHRVAAAGRSETLTRALLEHGAAMDATRGDGKTPYRLAYRAGHTAIAQLLQQSGADTSGLTPMDRFVGACMVPDERTARAMRSEHPDLAASMNASDRQLLVQAVETDRTESVSLMLDLGWSLAEESEWGGTPLHWAAWHGSERTARMLVARGAAINVRDSQYGSSPIAWAAHGSTNSRHASDEAYARIVTMLIEAGATPAESVNRWNEPPDSMATDMVAALLRPWLGVA